MGRFGADPLLHLGHDCDGAPDRDYGDELEQGVSRMIKWKRCCVFAFTMLFLQSLAIAEDVNSGQSGLWNQWRGPTRDGQFRGAAWPDRLDDDSLKSAWRVELPSSYSGPVVSSHCVFVTGTEEKEREVVFALDRKSGKTKWKAGWRGAVTVPFFAAANGSWIRSTPIYDGTNLYVAGMRDVLVCLDAETGQERWRVDFVEKFASPLPSFGFVCSPLVDGEFIYVQAGASLVKLEKSTGQVIWRTLADDGGMMGSAFSSPIISTIAGRRQLVVQTREKLAGINLDDGAVLWEKGIPSFRGMNILTPIVHGDSVFTSSYQNKSWLFQISASGSQLSVKEAWSNNAPGYMSTPVVVDGFAYIHLQNQRFACLDLKSGERTWTSTPFGKYSSLVAQGNRILALDQTGELLLFEANPKEFQLIDRRRISEQETWAHLALTDDEVYVRELNGLTALRWARRESTP